MIRKTSKIDVCLVRHGEAFKNLNKVHGGGDQRLTDVGLKQAKALGRCLASLNTELVIVHQPEERSEITAQQIGSVASRSILRNLDLEGVKLGIVSGLSEDELAKSYPEVARALIAWRTKQGDLSSRPKVPGSEPMEEFADRIRRGLIDSIDDCPPDSALALVSTTSTLNMLNHLLINDGEFDRGHYNFIDFPLGSYSSWQISEDPPQPTSDIMIPQLGAEII